MDGTNIPSFPFPEQPMPNSPSKWKNKGFHSPTFPASHPSTALSEKPLKFQSKRPKYNMAYAGPLVQTSLKSPFLSRTTRAPAHPSLRM